MEQKRDSSCLLMTSATDFTGQRISRDGDWKSGLWFFMPYSKN